jgi:hypothetical protein
LIDASLCLVVGVGGLVREREKDKSFIYQKRVLNIILKQQDSCIFRI